MEVRPLGNECQKAEHNESPAVEFPRYRGQSLRGTQDASRTYGARLGAVIGSARFRLRGRSHLRDHARG
jgi:hypothetical protein